MSSHDLWHVTVLTLTLLSGAGIAIVLLAPFAFESPPPGIHRARPWVLAAAALAIVLLVVEWRGIHGG